MVLGFESGRPGGKVAELVKSCVAVVGGLAAGDRAGTGHAQREDLHGYSTDAVQVVPARVAHHGRLFRLNGLEDS